ncbi:MAG: hypothetical protein ACOC40_02300, partial [Thermoplasmatota archaeon]
MIQIICDETETPQKVGYSQHYGGAKRDWGNVNKVDGTHPEVYVVKGGHASYFESGGKGVEIPELGGYYYEDYSGNGDILDKTDYSIKTICNSNWLNFQGDWG